MSESKEEKKWEQLVHSIDPQSRLVCTWSLEGGLSAQMTALEIRLPDGRIQKMILRCYEQGDFRRDQQRTADEFQLLQKLHEAGLAPAPLHLDTSGQIFSRPFLMIEYVEGQIDLSPANLADYLRQSANHLARIHRVDWAGLDLSFLPHGDGCVELKRERPSNVEPALDETRIRDALAAIQPPPQQNASALLHGDFWPGNTLWLDGRLTAVVDWEDAKLGDPLIDLAISRLDIVWIFGIEAMQAFTYHYQSMMALDDTNLPYWDLCAALRLIRLAGADLPQWVAFFPPYGRQDITVQSLLENYHYFITQAFEKLSFQV